jgi:ankyrin repeat protein
MIRKYFAILLFIIIGGSAPGQSQTLQNDNPVESLMNITGMKLKLQEYQRSLQDDMEQTILIVPVFRSMRRAFLDAYHPDSLYRDIERFLSDRQDTAGFRSVINWYQSPLGKKITDWQIRSTSSEAYERKTEIAASVQLQQTTEIRLSLFRRLDAAIFGSEIREKIHESFFRALIDRIDSIIPIKEAENKQEFMQYMRHEHSRLQTGIKGIMNAEYLYTYRIISDNELKQYMAFCESSVGQWYHRLLREALVHAATAAAQRVPSSIRTANSNIQYDLQGVLREKNEHQEDDGTDIQGWTELHFAAADGDTDKVNALIRFGGVDVNIRNAKGRTPLYEAAKRGKLGAVEVLVRRGANVNIQEGRYGFTPLHVAAEKKQLGVMEFLLTHGADVNARNDYGKTPLMQAAWQTWHRDASVAKILLFHGADINVKDIDEFTPLLSAVDEEHVPLVSFLIERGVNINTGTKSGYTPLMAATYKGNYDLVKLLLEHGANANAMYEGITALYYANKNRMSKISDLLRQYGGGDPVTKSRAMSHRGYELSDQEDYSGALVEFDRALKASVPSAELYYARGYCYWKLGKYPEALEDMKKAVYNDPDYISAWDLMARVHYLHNRYDDVIDCTDKCIQLEPQSGKSYTLRGYAYYKKGMIERAIEDLQRGCELGDNSGCKRLREIRGR